MLLRYSGVLGNTMFFVCSAWFLVDIKETNTRKIWRMILDVFVISVCWLIPMLIVKGIDTIGWDNVVKSLLPTFSETNWYITSYILFCFASPFLNIIIDKIDKNVHLSISIVLFLCYLVISLLKSFPGASTLVIWISIYFVVSYFKLYCPNICNNKKINIIFVIIGILGNIIFVTVTNFGGLRIDSLSTRVLQWNSNRSFLNFMTAFGLLNLVKDMNFRSRFVNYISSLSLLVYIIHENILFRTYIRPQIWQFIYLNLGYDLILLWHFMYVSLLLIASLIVAAIYKLVIQKYIHKFADITYGLISKICKAIHSFLFNKSN